MLLLYLVKLYYINLLYLNFILLLLGYKIITSSCPVTYIGTELSISEQLHPCPELKNAMKELYLNNRDGDSTCFGVIIGPS